MKNCVDFMKIIGICFIGILIMILAQGISSLFSLFHLFGFQYILQGGEYILCTYVLLKMFVEKVLQKKLPDYYITKFKMSKKSMILALGLPVMVILLTVLFVPGNFFFTTMPFAEKVDMGLYAFFFVGLSVGLVEELVFRGLILSTVIERYGKRTGIIIPSICFGALHLLNGKLNLASFILLILGGSLVGSLFSVLTYTNRTIWASTVVHSSWNFLIIGGLCNFGLNTNESAISNYVFKTDNLFLTGRQFGIEVSIVSIICYLLSIIYLMKKESH